MTKLIRGKVIAEKSVDAVSTGTALSSSGESTVVNAAENEITPVEELNPYRDGLTFAPPSAPWVGAERAWRSGIVPLPHEEWVNYKTRIDLDDALPKDDLTLTDIEVATVLSTLPPPSAAAKPATSKPASQVLKYAAIVAFAAVSALAVFGTLSRPKTDITAMNIAAQPEAVETLAATVSPDFSAASDVSISEAPTPSTVSEELDVVESHPAVAPARKPIRRSPARKAVHSPEPESAEVTNAEAAVAATEIEERAAVAETTESAPVSRNNDTFGVAAPYTDATDARPPAADNDDAAPSRDAVRQVMDSISAQVSKCALGGEGKLILKLEVAGATGRVTQAAAVNQRPVRGNIGGILRGARRSLRQVPQVRPRERYNQISV